MALITPHRNSTCVSGGTRVVRTLTLWECDEPLGQVSFVVSIFWFQDVLAFGSSSLSNELFMTHASYSISLDSRPLSIDL